MALLLFELSVIPTPPAAAGPDSMIVPVALLPPLTVEGDIVKLSNAGGLIVIAAVLEVLPRVPVIVAVFALWSGDVLTVNVPVVDPPCTVTEAGTLA